MVKTYGEVPKDSEGRKQWIIARVQEIWQLNAMPYNDLTADNIATTLFMLKCLLAEELNIEILLKDKE